MIIRRILIENAGPFLSEWEVELGEGVTAVVAEYEDAADRSNRGGKSWLAVDGLLYALFGRFRGRTDEFVHRLARGREAGFVEYDLESSEGRRFVVRRGRDRGGAPIREVDGVTVKEEALEELVRAEILGLSYEEFVLTNCFVQNRMHAFMEMTPAEKRRIVSPWFKTDRWVPRYDLAKKRLTAAKRRLTDLEREQENLQGHAERCLSDAAEVLPSAEAAQADARAALQDVIERRASLLAEVEADADRRRERSAAESALADAEGEAEEERKAAHQERSAADARLTRARQALAEANGRADQIKNLEREVSAREELRAAAADLSETLSKVIWEREEARRTRRLLLEKFESLTADRTGTCPILREPCVRVERDEEVIAGVRKEGLCARRAMERAERRIGEVEWKLGLTKSELNGAEEAEELLRSLREAVSVKQCAHDLEVARRADDAAEAALSKVKLGRSPAGKAVRAARKAFERLPKQGDGPTRALAEIADEREGAERVLREADTEVARVRALEAGGRRSEARLEEIDGELEDARAAVERLSWAAYAFGATGIPSRELENAFGVAEDSMNAVLADLGAPTRLRFSPSRELKEWEPACLGCGEAFARGERRHVCPECGLPRRKRRRDELRLEVQDGEADASFELDSGGGQVLLSLGARLGLAQLPGNSRAVRCECAVIDEPDGALDRPNRLALYRLLRDRLPGLGIRQTILITHADVRGEFDSVVLVRRWPDEDRSAFWRE